MSELVNIDRFILSIFIHRSKNTYLITSKTSSDEKIANDTQPTLDEFLLKFQVYNIGNSILIIYMLDITYLSCINFDPSLAKSYENYISSKEMPYVKDITLPSIEQYVDQFIYSSTKPAL